MQRLNPLLSWLTTFVFMFLTGMHHSCSLSSLHTSAFNVLRCKSNKSSYWLAISIFEFPDDVHSILLKSSFDACLEYHLTVPAKLNLKKNMYAKCIDYQKKTIRQLDLNPPPPESKWVALAVELSVLWFWGNVARLLCFKPAAKCNLITALTCSDKLEVGGWWVYGVR